MTTATVPEFIANLFENEIKKVVASVTKTISDKYNIKESDIAELLDKKLGLNLVMVPEESESFKVIRKKKEKKVKPDKLCCEARIYRNGMYTQCTRYQRVGDLCNAHDGKEKLVYGRVEDPVPLPKGKKRMA